MRDLERLAAALEAAGKEPHLEPDRLDEQGRFEAEISDHSQLHALRRIAARVALGAGITPIADPDLADEDQVVDLYYERGGTPTSPGVLGSVSSFIWRRDPVFQHLMFHGDTAGFYLPRDFKNVIIVEDELAVPGGIIGSVPRLLAECRQLAERLEVTADFEAEDLGIPWKPESKTDEPPVWLDHREAAYCLVALRSACHAAMRVGAVVYFD